MLAKRYGASFGSTCVVRAFAYKSVCRTLNSYKSLHSPWTEPEGGGV